MKDRGSIHQAVLAARYTIPENLTFSSDPESLILSDLVLLRGLSTISSAICWYHQPAKKEEDHTLVPMALLMNRGLVLLRGTRNQWENLTNLLEAEY